MSDKSHGISGFFQSTTVRLALSYLAIIMAMSIGFSCVFYNTSAHELNRPIPSKPFIIGMDHGREYLQKYIDARADEGRRRLLGKLVLVNLGALAAGSYVSYFLARRTLEPIERAMEAQSRFTSDASHELRTPLASMQAENEVALRNKGLTLDRAKQVLQSNLEEAIRLRDLSDGLLQLARVTGKDIAHQPVHLEAVATDALNGVVALAQAKDIAIDDEVHDSVVLGDQRLLTQAVVILLDNAIKYSPDGTRLHLGVSQSAQHAIIKVRDEGPGIDHHDQQRIFDRFYRVDQSRTSYKTPGHGLGLSIARKIVEQHEGQIRVESVAGRGATFIITLPRLA